MDSVAYESVYFTYESLNGEIITAFDEESALIELLAAHVLWMSGGFPDGQKCELFVLCNDLFYWGTADGEDLPTLQLEPLYKAWKANGFWGVSKWCCMQRRLRPQAPIEKAWRECGQWDDELEELPKPEPS